MKSLNIETITEAARRALGECGSYVLAMDKVPQETTCISLACDIMELSGATGVDLDWDSLTITFRK